LKITHSETTTPRPLRKDSLRKRRSIIAAATEMFIELGYSKASMNNLVNRTGVSKSTLYKHFKNKETLFVAVIDEEMQDHLGAIENLDLTNMDIECGLRRIAVAGLGVLCTEKHVNICRIVYAEAARIPSVGQIYYEHGPKQGIAGVAGFLKEMVKSEKINCRDVDKAADYFWGMLLHKLMLARYCGVVPAMSNKRLQTYVDDVVDEFLVAFIEIE